MQPEYFDRIVVSELEQELAKLQQGDHLCSVYENVAEQIAVIIPFILDGLVRGERSLYIADDRAIEMVAEKLTGAGVDVALVRKRRALWTLTQQDSYLKGGEFDPQAMIDFLRSTQSEALADGFAGLRVAGEMTWALGPEFGCDRLIEYETLLNDFVPNSRSIILCLYDNSRFDPAVIHDVLRTHPIAILGDQVCPNPYYEPPALVLSQEPRASAEFKRKRAAWWIAQLKRAQAAERKRGHAEKALRESEARFRETVELIPAAVYVCDQNGIIQQFNRRALELWGREPRPDEDVRFCGAIRHFRIDGATLPREELPIVGTVRNGTPVRNQEVVIERADGSRVAVLVNIAPIRNSGGALVGAINCFLDVTDRREAEEKLRQSERRLAEAQQVAHLGSWERDLLTDEVTWSDELYRLFGLQPNEGSVSYQRFLDFVAPQDVDRIRAMVDAAIRDRSSFRGDYRITLPDGSIRVLNDQGRIILNVEGEPIRLVGTAQDVTELRRAEHEREEYTVRLQALSRRLLEVQEEERRHLARELHDEVGQLLTGLRLLLKPHGDWTSAAGSAKFEQAQAIVDQLLDKVRNLSFDLRPAALDQLGTVPALLELFESYMKQTGVQVDFKHQNVDGRFAPEVETTAYRIVQEALTNVARHAGVDRATVRVWATPDLLSVQIEDRGRGFDAEAVLAASRSNGLTGMRERVKLLDGQLTIDSRPGGPTQITAEIPYGNPTGEDKP